MYFEEFWEATGEQPFDALTSNLAECYRLSINASRGSDHRVICMQRKSADDSSESMAVAHFLTFTKDDIVLADTHRIPLEARHWSGLTGLLEVAEFWHMPEQVDRCGFDGAMYTIEAFKLGHQHRLERWSPCPIASGGELVCVVTDYLERLGYFAAYECEFYKRYGWKVQGQTLSRRPTRHRVGLHNH